MGRKSYLSCCTEMWVGGKKRIFLFAFWRLISLVFFFLLLLLPPLSFLYLFKGHWFTGFGTGGVVSALRPLAPKWQARRGQCHRSTCLTRTTCSRVNRRLHPFFSPSLLYIYIYKCIFCVRVLNLSINHVINRGKKERRGEKDGERLYHHEWDGEERPINKMNLFALSRREIQFDMPDWARWATHFFFFFSLSFFLLPSFDYFGRSQGSQPPHLHLNGFRSIRAISMQQLDGLVWSQPLLL